MKQKEIEFLKNLYQKILDNSEKFLRSDALGLAQIIEKYEEEFRNKKLIQIRKNDDDWWYNTGDKYFVSHATEEDMIRVSIKDDFRYYWRVIEGDNEDSIIRKEDSIIL